MENVQYFSNIEIHIIGLAILLIIFVNIQQKKEKLLFNQKLFLVLLFSNALAIILDIILLCLDGRQGSLVREFYYFLYILYYFINPVPCLLWSLYADFIINRDERRLPKLLPFLLIPIIINAVLSLLSPFNHFLFYLDAQNFYHRGSYFLILAVICYFYILYTFIRTIANKDKIKKSTFYSLLIFALPPTVGGLLQTMYYGTTVLWVSVAISLLIVYINIQNTQLHTDHLTGLSNRRRLDNYLADQIRKKAKNSLQAGIMIDLDSFKEINDLYGHAVGDQALEKMGSILKDCFRKDDFIARYGGDEFIVFFEVTEQKDMENAVRRIRKNVEEFNNSQEAPYRIRLSMGYDIYHPESGMTIQQFIEHIDLLMYEEKKYQKN